MLVVFAITTHSALSASLDLICDNDFLYSPRNKDWDYTGGLALEWNGAQVKTWGLTAPLQGLDYLLLGHLGLLDSFSHAQHTLIFGGTIYTPHDITRADPIPGDRPYGALLFVATRSRRTDAARDPGMAVTSELTVGVLGLRLADDIQAPLHDLLMNGQRHPHGWAHQISHGGEPTLEYRAAFDARLLRESVNEHADWWQAVAGVEAAAGYNTYGWAGGMLKLGYMDKDYGVPGSIIQPLVGRGSASAEHDARRREGYLFVRAGGYAVAYNALLEGQFRHSDVTFAPDQIEHWRNDFQLGVVGRFSRLSVMYSVTRNSAEFRGSFAEPHYFGTVVITWSADF